MGSINQETLPLSSSPHPRQIFWLWGKIRFSLSLILAFAICSSSSYSIFDVGGG